MPGKFVFPGGASTRPTTAFRLPAPIPKALEANLLKGSPKITPSRARSLAVAAIREACEETGLCLGRKSNGAAPKLEGEWKRRTAPGPSVLTRAIRSSRDRRRMAVSHSPSSFGAAPLLCGRDRARFPRRPRGSRRPPMSGRATA